MFNASKQFCFESLRETDAVAFGLKAIRFDLQAHKHQNPGRHSIQ